MIEIDLNLNRPEKIRVEDLKTSDHIGFVDSDGDKGYLVYVGDNSGFVSKVSTIRLTEGEGVPNKSYGAFEDNNTCSVIDALNIVLRCGGYVKTAYKFESLKALHRWLGEE